MLAWKIRYLFPAYLRRKRHDFYHWLARQVPRRLVYWCFIVAFAHATGGKYGNTVVPELSAADALKRYGNEFGLHS